ncbi:MAG: S24/S26 family peptidase [Acholeplasmatales bacterium]|nr:S24/S26 family peptidase [Acholeplasmatales bacterium]
MIKVEKFYPLILEAFNENKTFSFPIKGTSMRPLFKNDDIVTLDKVDSYMKGDILFYRRNDGSFVLHRLRKIKNGVLYIVGDHQTALEKVEENQLIGKVISYKKKDKDKIYYLKGVKYNIYKFIVKFKFIRYVFSHIYK